jgi:TolB-like protein
LPDKPSIAVLPFANLSGDPQQEYFSDGITDDLVTDLSRVPGLFVIDRSSTFAYKGKPTKVQEVGRELGVKYVLEGSARKTADRVRINVQLVDASTGDQVWTSATIGSCTTSLRCRTKSSKALLRLSTCNSRSWRGSSSRSALKFWKLTTIFYFLRGFEYFLSPTPEGLANGRKMFEKAAELDPGYANAYGAMAFSYLVGYIWQLDRDPGVLDRAVELVNKAIALDDSFSDT